MEEKKEKERKVETVINTYSPHEVKKAYEPEGPSLDPSSPPTGGSGFFSKPSEKRRIVEDD